jgi:hypothetical protein
MQMVLTIGGVDIGQRCGVRHYFTVLSSVSRLSWSSSGYGRQS